MRLVHRRRSFFDPKSDREPIVLPVGPMGYHSYESVDLRPSQFKPGQRIAMTKNRTYVPYQEGDLVFANFGGYLDPGIVLVRVMICFLDYQPNEYYIPKWKVQPATKDGHWSNLWRYCWPGHIFRAYHHQDECPREDMPTEIKTIQDLRPFDNA